VIIDNCGQLYSSSLRAQLIVNLIHDFLFETTQYLYRLVTVPGQTRSYFNFF